MKLYYVEAKPATIALKTRNRQLKETMLLADTKNTFPFVIRHFGEMGNK